MRIEYLGCKAPRNHTANIQFIDRDHGSREGFERERKRMLILLESERVPQAEWEARVEQFFTASPYPGLSVMGGIATTDDALRPHDREITEDEYHQIAQRICAANDATARAKADQDLRDNDIWRRPARIHEQRSWRTRVWISSFALLERHVAYALAPSVDAYARVRVELPTGATSHLVDIYHDVSGTVAEAMLAGMDHAEYFADLLGFYAFGAASVVEIISTGPTTCRSGEVFLIAIPAGHLENDAVRVGPEKFGALAHTQVDRLTLQNLRDGHAAESLTRAYGFFWNAVERSAEIVARHDRQERTVTCAKCGEERTVGPNLKYGFQMLYRNAEQDPEVFDAHRALRGKIQHGAYSRGTSSYELAASVTSLQAVATIALADQTKCLPSAGQFLRSTDFAATLRCVVASGALTVELERHSIRFGVSAMPERWYESLGRGVLAGWRGSPPANNLMVPPVDVC